MIRHIAADRWREAGALFHELVELDDPTRSERLERLGDSDPELRLAVEALIAGDARADQALPTPGFGLGALARENAGDALGISGQTIGRFHVIEQVAWGGMGVVYRAEDLQLHRDVALKFPLLDHDATETSRALTLREARSAGALDHPNLCPIYDVGESAEGPFFVMPLYRGETLKDRIAREAPLSVADSLVILDQLASGLACAHAAGVVHCDIKPGNIMLLPDGTVKLLDFGLARAVAAGLSVPSGVVGTLAYMAPEQVRNQSVDARTDLWALGVILYEMLAGRRPFAGDGAAQTMNAILESEPPPLGESVAAVSPAVRTLLRSLLTKDPTARLQTADALTTAIAATRRRPSRHRTARRFAVIGGAAAVIGLLASALWLRPANTLIGRGALVPHETIVLADFDISGLDSSISPALTTLLRRDFADSKGVLVMTSSGVTSALERMRRPPGTPITTQLAREIALRDGLHAVLSGRISPLAAGYLITLTLADAQTGNELAVSTSMAVNAERELLPALTRAAQEMRRAIGASSRDATSPSKRTPKPLTTTSLEAARLMWGRQTHPPPVPERIAAARAAISLDSTFAYAWMSIGNMLSWTEHRSNALDSAFTLAYRFRDNATLMERAQIGSMYSQYVRRDRRTALTELESALDVDTTMLNVVPLNITVVLNDTRQFERAEAFARRIENWKTVGTAVRSALVASQVAQGKYAAADSVVMRTLAGAAPGDVAGLVLARAIALGRLRFDSAEALLNKMPRSDAVAADWAAIYRLRGKLAESHALTERLDSASAASAAAAGARYDRASRRALMLAREALWIKRDPAGAVASLDARWGATSAIVDIQDRINGMQAAALYAAAGRPTIARTLVARFESGADTLAKRALYEHQHSALAEIALAQGKYVDAMRLFRESDFAADGLPANACVVCVLPHLARVAGRAGWSDSARTFWTEYVTRPAIQRLTSDQWFLATAYGELARLASSRGDSAEALAYRRALTALRGEPPL